ncbi:MAG: hypothetical protein HYX53_08660 [Chloroflexi bacterium]|nr:hypothetical protein [Chloroflexota bacterium]
MLRCWVFLTAALYLAGAILLIGNGISEDPADTAKLLLLGSPGVAGPLAVAWGVRRWNGRRRWLARVVGLVLMIAGFVPLLSLSVIALPFVLLSLPAAWPWSLGATEPG